jgi:type III secretion protein Q
MLDEMTQVTQNNKPATLATPRLPPAANRIRLSALQKLTRAHLAINARPAACAALVEATERVAQKLGPQLKTTIACEASVLASTIHPFSHLAARALFVTLEFGGEALGVLELDLLGAGAVLSKITGGQEPVGIPTRLSHIEEAALGWVALYTLAELRAEAPFKALTPRLVSVTLDRTEVLRAVDARLRHLAVELQLTIGETRCLGRLLVPSLWAQSKFDALPVEDGAPLLEEVGNVTVPARCLIGHATVSRREAAALTVGDVVVLANVTQDSSGLLGAGRVLAPSFELRGTFTAEGFTLTRAFERPTQESEMSQVDPSVPVEVEIELTRLRLPLHQLGNVRPGSVLPLHINAAQQVVVRIGDKAVARAELVEIEGEIGARIISML